MKKDTALDRPPEELIYRAAYAPVNVSEMLASAETRGRIRRLPVPHLFFGLTRLEDREVQKLLPHVTEEQWAGILDLDVWTRDRMSIGKFLQWERHVVEAEAPVARKLVRAADPELWELTFRRELKIYARTGEDGYEGEREGECLETPDGNYVLVLPGNPEKARLLRSLILRLYDLDANYASLLLESCRVRVSAEIEEAAYENRKRRVEDLGFQDYFEAIEIYTYLPTQESLPEKRWDQIREISTLPVALPEHHPPGLLIFQAMAQITLPHEVQTLLEELFFVCNKLLSADSVWLGDLKRVRGGIRKAVAGMNLGLDWWAKGNLQRAVDGIRRHYFQSFFQIGYSRLLDLQREAQAVKQSGEIGPGSLVKEVLDGLWKPYPLYVEEREGRIRKRFFRIRQDLETIQQYLEQIPKPQTLDP